jgi:large subunit ribosomal protein L23
MKQGLLSTKKRKISFFDILRRPIVTEKSTLQGEIGNKVVFEVLPGATKNDVKLAMKDVFSVTVEKVNIIRLPAKTKRFKGVVGQRNAIKKAIITLKDGETLNFFDGV